MTNYAYGWDYSWYRPSDSTLTSNGVQFVCRYLSYDTTGKNITPTEYAHKLSIGIAVVLNWEWGANDALDGYSRGVQHATEAESQRQALGAPSNAPIYFSVDFDATPGQQAAIDNYLNGAASVIGHARVGVYGGYYVVERCYANGSASWFWQTYAWSGGSVSSHAHIYQFNNGIQGGQADENHALQPNYGQIKPDGTVGSPTTGAVSLSASSSMVVFTGSAPPGGGGGPVHLPTRPFELADPRSIRLLVAGPDLKPLSPLTTWSSIEATLNLNDAAQGTLTIPADQSIYDLVAQPGNRLHLYYQGRVFLAGPIVTVETPEQAGVPDVMTVTWTNDLWWLASRLTYPDPGQESTGTQPASYTLNDTNAETALRTLVNLNAGPGAIASRRAGPYSKIVLEAAHSPLLGSNVSVSAPMSQTLTDTLRDAAAASTPPLAFDVVLDDTVPQLVFRVWAPEDLSSRVRYTRGLNNLSSLTITSTAPTTTLAIVGTEATVDDSDNSVPGKAWERSADTDLLNAWGRLETYVSSNADSETTSDEQTTQSNQDGDQALSDGAQSVAVAAEVVDSPGRQYGLDYPLGAKVGVTPTVGTPVAAQVQSVTLTASPQDGVQVAPGFGDDTTFKGSVLIAQIQDLQRQVARLQAGRRG